MREYRQEYLPEDIGISWRCLLVFGKHKAISPHPIKKPAKRPNFVGLFGGYAFSELVFSRLLYLLSAHK